MPQIKDIIANNRKKKKWSQIELSRELEKGRSLYRPQDYIQMGTRNLRTGSIGVPAAMQGT